LYANSYVTEKERERASFLLGKHAKFFASPRTSFPQPIWQRYYKTVRTSPAWIAHGKLERKSDVIHMVVNRIEDLSEKLTDLNMKSRDFR
jgi:hypothetical protein